MDIKVYNDQTALGQAVAHAVSETVVALQENGKTVRIVFAAAPSQDDFLAALIQKRQINWRKIEAFHMDDYIGLPAESDQSFRYYLQSHLFDHVDCDSVHFIDVQAEDSLAVCQNYAALLQQKPVDIVCLGIGENGHIAFNDPPVADFNDPAWVKIVELDQACRQQQVNDGCFANLDQVPTHAITLTIPALMSGKQLFCTVPGERKAKAVYRALNEPISTACPATILREHSDIKLFLDEESASLAKE